ncbi:transposase [Chryseobacterium ginsenosidimutans]|uniref:IS110 family transposase n=2 Tax=Chryseobacterium ginsenosidimutans TaxID=687846 RepID=UPI00216748EE|nr:IS110 family transposase [Chryseobacterium ginsenosidimutans]MCS3867829.1 transposase [Chryseobacterium ginsenosidimutans]MCS3868184.1 transposase [Chryseobacterium ginsenosidimutans]MCS3868617.1 transposase [Chryseobacterium ginsenosidimutans]MCS3869320.1 transposase [Chryseobacterium ginsenosidimutans]
MEKQCIGIDISKDYLDCCFGTSDSFQNQKFGKSKRFKNDYCGYKELLQWSDEQNASREVFYVMEATGVYYEHLAYFLNEHHCKLSVLLPNMVKHYSRSLNVKTKTDQKDSEVLCRLGLERKLRTWNMPTKIMRDLKFLSREYREVKAKINQAKNQLHAKHHSHDCPVSTQKRLKTQVSLLEVQVSEIESELRLLVMSDTEFSDKVKKICSIPGVSFITTICIIAETNAFALITNGRQLASYAGLDIQHNQSGNKEGKTRISKKGNSFIRHSLYMPALCATRFNPLMKEFYNNLKDRKPVKKIAVIAVARKLLILIYKLWKSNMEFDPNYIENKKIDRVAPAYTG